MTADQQIRAAALRAAIALRAVGPSPKTIAQVADAFEKYIRDGKHE